MQSQDGQKRSPTLPDPRWAYREEDVQALVASARFLVAADAYSLGCGTLEQMLRLAFTAPPCIPRGLHAFGFASLVHDVGCRLRAGELEVREERTREYQDFYRHRIHEEDNNE